MKVYEIMKDLGRMNTSYFSLTDDKFFDGDYKITPLTQAKRYAKAKGYQQLKKISTKMGVDDKVYNL